MTKRPLPTRAALGLALALALAAPARGEATFYDGVAAYVNDKVVTVDTVMREMRMNFDLSRVPQAQLPGRIRELYPVMRDLLVDRLLILEAYEASGAQLPNEAVNARVQAVVAESFGGDTARLREALRENRMTYEEWVKQLRANMIVAAMRQLQVDQKITVSPKKVRAYYAAHPERFAERGGVHVRTITIDPKGGEAAAKRAAADLEAGKPFAEVAKAFSCDSQAANGGDWGFVDPHETFAAPIAATIAALKPGETSPILDLGGWHMIVRKVAVRSEGVRPLAEVWEQATRAVREELGRQRYDAWVGALRKAAYVRNVDVTL